MTTWKIKLDENAKKDLKNLDIQTKNTVIDYLYNRILKLEYPTQLGKALKREFRIRSSNYCLKI